MMTVACLLWGDWCYPHGPDYVRKLRDRVAENLSTEHRFVCFADREIDGVETVALDPCWRWNLNKLALFRPDNGLEGRVLALDLDTVPIGSLDEIASYDGTFAMCESFGQPGKCGGSILSFEAGEMEWLYDKVRRNPKFWGRLTDGSERMLYRQCLKDPDFLQDHVPGQIVSYKWHCREGIPDNARIICFHGVPRPHEIGY